MSGLEAIRVALKAIAANRLRAGLTALGVVIGVMSVVVLVAVGTGARDEVTAGVESLGSNLVFVVPGSGDFGAAPSVSPFRIDDVDDLERRLAGRADVTASIVSGERLRAEGQTAVSSVLGVTSGYGRVVNRPVERGAFIGDSDVATSRRVAVLGASTAQALFGQADPIGRTVTIGGLRFRVIGEAERQGATLGVDADAQVYIPITAAQRLFASDRVDSIFVRAADADGIPLLVNEVEAVLSTRTDPDDFTVLTQDEVLGVAGEILDTLTLVLAAIAGISLLVGGIGVSNIMLVSVTERTREIGLRKALGARTRDITAQFLVEAVVLCGVGGVVGIGAGVGLSAVAAALTPLPATVTTWSVALAFGTSVGVGVIFGVLPARRAGRLDPVVALRSE